MKQLMEQSVIPTVAKWLVICALPCLWTGLVNAAEISDPFGTDSMLPPRPALRLGNTVGNPCAAQPVDHALNLLEVVNLALCNNPQTRVAWANSRVQAAQVGVSKAAYLPDVSLSASDNHITGTAAPGVDQRDVGVTLSYLLYDFGSRSANLENARQLLAAASATQDSTVQTVFLAAVQAFYQAQATSAALDAAYEAERASKESLAAAEARYNAGSATPADKLQAQTAYSQATLNRITADGNLKNAQGTLANVLGLDADRNVSLVAAEGTASTKDSTSTNPYPNPLPGKEPSPQSSPASGRGGERERQSAIPAGEGANDASQEGEALKIFDGNIAALIEEARRRRPDLQAAAAQVKAAQASADAARAAGRPTISLTASADRYNTAGVNSNGSLVGINLNVPIFSGYSTTYQVRAAEAQTDVKSGQLEQLRLQVALDVWTAYQNLNTATQSLRSSVDLLNSAEQSERVALGRYKAGVGSILDVLSAQSALASARQQRIQATLSWNVSRATLAQAMGSLDADLLQTLSDVGSQRPGENTSRKTIP